jgi:1-deoxy-D-xylulose-5-phosphate synthase
VEDGVKKGGIGRDLENILLKGAEKKICTEVLGFPDSFVANGNRAQILEEAGLSPEKIVFASKELLK